VLLDFVQWMFINLMVAVGLVFLSGYPPLAEEVQPAPRYPWRAVAAASIMAVFCMLFPWVVAPGQNMDLRLAPLILVGRNHGWQKAIPVGLVIIAVRLFTGGRGMLPAVIWTVLCLLVLPFFQGRPRTLLSLASLGVIHAAIGWALALTGLLPFPPVLSPLSPYWLMLAAVEVIGLLLINAAMEHVRERHNLERQLEGELRAREAVLGLIPYGVLLLDDQRRMTACNQAARELMHGGQVPPQWFSHPDVAWALQAQQRISGCRISYPDGETGERIVIISAVPLQSGGAVLGIQNVTGVVRQEREEARQDRLELLGRLAATAAHEIKNPLTTIKGFLQLLGRRPEFAPHRPAFALVQGEVEQINRVVSDFLGLAANPVLNPVRFPLDELLHEVLTVAGLQFPGSPVAVRLAGDEGLAAETDRHRLKQILQNLVMNAYEAMPAGGRLTLERTLSAGELLLTVVDSGPGITPDMLPLIFTPYMTTKATGTGLGLAISHRLATDMGGRLDVASEGGRGSTFRLRLPQREGALVGAGAPGGGARLHAAEPAVQRPE
jgi:signal transduction histidine kinase